MSGAVDRPASRGRRRLLASPVQVEAGGHRGPGDGARRFTPVAFHWDTRARMLETVIDDSLDPEIQAQRQATSRGSEKNSSMPSAPRTTSRRSSTSPTSARLHGQSSQSTTSTSRRCGHLRRHRVLPGAAGGMRPRQMDLQPVRPHPASRLPRARVNRCGRLEAVLQRLKGVYRGSPRLGSLRRADRPRLRHADDTPACGGALSPRARRRRRSRQ